MEKILKKTKIDFKNILRNYHFHFHRNSNFSHIIIDSLIRALKGFKFQPIEIEN